MGTKRFRRAACIAGVVAIAGLVAACASEQPPPPPPGPPPAAEAPPPPPPPPPPAAAMPGGFIVARDVHLHVAPRVRSHIVATLRRGMHVEALGPARGRWQHVHTRAGNGWVIGGFLRPAG